MDYLVSRRKYDLFSTLKSIKSRKGKVALGLPEIFIGKNDKLQFSE